MQSKSFSSSCQQHLSSPDIQRTALTHKREGMDTKQSKDGFINTQPETQAHGGEMEWFVPDRTKTNRNWDVTAAVCVLEYLLQQKMS